MTEVLIINYTFIGCETAAKRLYKRTDLRCLLAGKYVC